MCHLTNCTVQCHQQALYRYYCVGMLLLIEKGKYMLCSIAKKENFHEK